MFSNELVKAPLEAAVEAEMVVLEGEVLGRNDRVEGPIVERDLDRHHPAVARRLFDDLPVVDQPEPFTDADPIGRNIRLDARTRQPPEALCETLIVFAA